MALFPRAASLTLVFLGVVANVEGATESPEVVLSPKAYAGPLRNPLMGFIGPANGRHEYATLAREYVKWNTIETSAGDPADKLRA